MALITPFEDDPKDECLVVAEELFKEAGLALADLTKKIRRHELDAGRAAKAALTEVLAAYQLAMKERNRVAEDRRKGSGIAGDYAIDFDAARDEIGRRLACLRDARDG